MRDLALVFLKLGATSFGGPAAHVALMEEEVVRRRRWLTRGEFLDLLGATQFIPGPNSTEMAIYVGHARAGLPGLLVAGISFILPASLIVTAIAWGYARYGSLPEVEGILRGVKPVIVAVIVQALWSLGRAAVQGWKLAAICAAAAGANALGVGEVTVIFLGGALSLAALGARVGGAGLALAALAPHGAAAAGAAATAPFSLGALFLFFLKVGSVLFGSGYVLVAFLQADLVEKLGWLTGPQLFDAVAVGQFTPGPLSSTATFIGYLLGGWGGAVAATVGMFLPAFVFVALSAPLISKLKRAPWARALLDGVNAASLAVMGVAAWMLGREAVVDLFSFGASVVSAVLLIRFRINSAWLVLAGGLAGFLLDVASRGHVFSR